MERIGADGIQLRRNERRECAHVHRVAVVGHMVWLKGMPDQADIPAANQQH
jgi:hypothetical protein